jgi:hypothetical protein
VLKSEDTALKMKEETFNYLDLDHDKIIEKAELNQIYKNDPRGVRRSAL